MKILLADDEVSIQKLISGLLEDEGHECVCVEDGTDALEAFENASFDLVILDVMMPRMDGFATCRELRTRGVTVPVIFLSAKGDIVDKGIGFAAGGDDYMTKPFSPEELLARIRALSRRQGDVLLEDIHWADLTLKLSSRTLHCGAKSVSLGFKEFEVLKILLANPNGIVSKEELIVKVWGSDSNAEDNNVEAYISFLRKKFFYLGSRTGIGTVRKVGYHLEENA